MVLAEVPVVDSSAAYGSSGYPPAGLWYVSGASAGGGATAPASAQGELFMQLQQMQQEIALLRGMLEEQQNEIQRYSSTKAWSVIRISRSARLGGGATGAASRLPTPLRRRLAGRCGGRSSAGASGSGRHRRLPIRPRKSCFMMRLLT